MDKLELDARVARLERRVSWVTGFLVLACAAASLMSLMRIEATPSAQMMEPATIATPAPAPAIRQIGTAHGVKQLGAVLRTLRDMQLEGLISLQDLEAKKASILAQPLNVTDYASDMKAAKALQLEGILSLGDYEALKKRILDTDG